VKVQGPHDGDLLLKSLAGDVLRITISFQNVLQDDQIRAILLDQGRVGESGLVKDPASSGRELIFCPNVSLIVKKHISGDGQLL